MEERDVVPELKQILGAMIFGATHPLRVTEMLKCLREVAESEGERSPAIAAFRELKPKDIQAALDALAADLDRAATGFHLREAAGGYRLQSDANCGRWVRHLLDIGKRTRLSRPALETLAIIAYRQPVTRVDIEAVRGVNVDHMLKMLMEMQLIRISGRSDLPGRPFLYGTSQRFLEYFGLKDLKDLASLDPMLASYSKERREAQKSEAEGETLPADDARGEEEPVFEADEPEEEESEETEE